MDISQMSDEELLKIAGTSQPVSDVSKMSDEELMRIAGISTPGVQTGPVSDLTKKINQEKSVKDKAIAEAKLIEDPAKRDQALRDAMRLGKATEGQVSKDVEQVKDYVGTHGTPATTYEGQTINIGDVGEKSMTDFTVELLTSTPTGKVIGAGMLSATALGVASKVKTALGPVSKGTEYLVNRIVAGLPEEEALAKTEEIINLVKSIPKDQQAYALANMTEGKMGFDNIKRAITNASDDTKLAAKLNNTLQDRRQVVQAVTSGNSDVAAAQVKWSEMLDKVNEVSPNQFSTESLKNSLDYVSNIYGLEGTSKASQIVRQIKADTAEPTLSASQALNVRKGVNELIRKAPQGSREVTELNKIKASLDNFIETTLPPEVNQLVKDTTSEYSRVINNKKFSDIITKNTSQGIGVDWAKVLKDAKKDGLHSEEVTIATNIAKAFESKFKYDKQLSSVAAPKGVDEASGGLMFFLTMVSNKVRDVASPLYNRTRAENLKIQSEIEKAIRTKGTSFTETLTGLAKNKNIPEEFRLGVFQKLADDFGEPTVVKSGSVVEQATNISEKTGRPVSETINEVSTPVDKYSESVNNLANEGYQVGSKQLDDGTFRNYAVKDGDVFEVGQESGKLTFKPIDSYTADRFKKDGFDEVKPLEETLPKSSEEIVNINNKLQSKIGSTISGTKEDVPFETNITDVEAKKSRFGMEISLKGDNGDVNFSVYTKGEKGKTVYGFDSTDLPKGANLGYELNSAGWDFIKSQGGEFYPDQKLTGANAFRSSLNMLKYANEKGWDNVDFIHIRENMYGFNPEGISEGVNKTLPLTRENLTRLNKNLVNGIVKDKLDLKGISLTNIPEEELNKRITEKLSGVNDLSITPSSVKALIQYLKKHTPETMFGLVPILPLLDTKEASANVPKARQSTVKDYFASIESGGRYDAINKDSGAYGKYQIHPVMMKELGITKDYLTKPENQEKVMDSLLPKYQARLEQFNLPTTKENMFVLHNLGTTGGIRVLRGNYTKEDLKNMANQLPGNVSKDSSSVVYNYSNRYNVEIPKRAN